MIDIKLIRDNPHHIKERLSTKNVDPQKIDTLLDFDTQWRALMTQSDELKNKQKKLEKENEREKARKTKEKIHELRDRIEVLEKKKNDILHTLPNIPADEALIGKDERDNKVIREIGIKPDFDFKPQDHMTIAEKLHIIDVKHATQLAGSRFGYLRGGAAMLELSLIHMAFNTLTEEGFIPIIPPVMIRPEVFRGMGRLSPDQEEERYYIPKDDVYLVGSSEHSVGPLHMNEMFELKELSKRYVAFSTCFRREAGTYGKDTKGILRVHQFDKVEMFVFSHPDQSNEEHLKLLALQERLMQILELPYRVVEICTGDMGYTDTKQFDIETWFPSQNTYRETHSCSNTTDFQSRGINVRTRGKNNAPIFVHTLNATAIAVGRIIIALIENNQTKQGTVRLPKSLHAYMGCKEIVA